MIPFMQGGRLRYKQYILVDTGYVQNVGTYGNVPERFIQNGRLMEKERILMKILQDREAIRKIKGAIVMLKIDPINMRSFEAFLANHKYPAHADLAPRGLVPITGSYRRHLWARRVLIDCPDISIYENTSEFLAAPAELSSTKRCRSLQY